MVPLAANFSAAIPRATASQAAAKLIKYAGPYGLATFAVYSLVSPYLGMNSDGTVSSTGSPTISAVDPTGAYLSVLGSTFATTWEQAVINSSPNREFCWVTQTYENSTYITYSVVARVAPGACRNIGNGYAYKGSCPSGSSLDKPTGVCLSDPTCTAPSTYDLADGLCHGVLTTPSETQLADSIQQSAAPTPELVDTVLNDSIARGFSAEVSGLITPNTPMAVEASPVEGPDEEVSSITSPNPDGSTSTTVKKEKATATPSPTGSTAGDIVNTWNVSTVTTTTTTNNTTNVSSVSTEVVQQGENPPDKSDLCALHPEILACQTLDDAPDVPPVDLLTQAVGSFTMPTSVAGSCPDPIVNTLANGQQVVYTFQPVCDYGTALRPFVIIVALIAAGYIVTGSVRMQS